MIKDLSKQTYREDGYCLVENLIPRAAIAAVRDRVLEMLEDQI